MVRRLEACQSPVWDTGLAVTALLDAGRARRRRRGRPGRALAAGRGGARPRRLGGAPPAAGPGRLGVRVRQRPLPRHRRHRRGGAGAAPRRRRHRPRPRCDRAAAVAWMAGMQSPRRRLGRVRRRQHQPAAGQAAVLRLRRGDRPAVGRRHRARGGGAGRRGAGRLGRPAGAACTGCCDAPGARTAPGSAGGASTTCTAPAPRCRRWSPPASPRGTRRSAGPWRGWSRSSRTRTAAGARTCAPTSTRPGSAAARLDRVADGVGAAGPAGRRRARLGGRAPRRRLAGRHPAARRHLGRAAVHRHRLPRRLLINYHLYRLVFPVSALGRYVAGRRTRDPRPDGRARRCALEHARRASAGCAAPACPSSAPGGARPLRHAGPRAHRPGPVAGRRRRRRAATRAAPGDLVVADRGHRRRRTAVASPVRAAAGRRAAPARADRARRPAGRQRRGGHRRGPPRLARAGALAVDTESRAGWPRPAAAVRGGPRRRRHPGRPAAVARARSSAGWPRCARCGRRRRRSPSGRRRSRPREVVLATPRSFCAGVDRAIEVVERALDRHGAPVYVRRQVVHNTHVVRDLESARRGLRRGGRRGAGRRGARAGRARGGAGGPRRGRGRAVAGRRRRHLPAGQPRCTPRSAATPGAATPCCSSATASTRRSRAPSARRPATSSSVADVAEAAPGRRRATRAGSPTRCRRPSPSTRPRRSPPSCAERFPALRGAAPRRHLLRHHQPPAAVRGLAARHRPRARGRLGRTRSNSVRLVEVAERGGRPGPPRRGRRRTSTCAGWPAPAASASPPAPRPRRTWSTTSCTACPASARSPCSEQHGTDRGRRLHHCPRR